MPLTQLTVFSNQGGYYPEVVERRFDLVYQALQQIQEELGRADLTAPAAQGISAVPTMADLLALTARPTLVSVAGFAAQNDGFEGLFRVVLGDTTPADNVLVANPTSGPACRYFRLYDERVEAGWFTSAGSTVQAAANAAHNEAFIVPPGSTVTIAVPSQQTTIANAINAIRRWQIPKDALVTINVADGTYAMGTSAIGFNHVDGARIRLVGNTTTPANCVLEWSPGVVAAVYASLGNIVGFMDGFECKLTTAVGRANGGTGLLAEFGGVIRTGPNMIVRSFWFCVFARNKGAIDFRGTSPSVRPQVFGGGDSNIIALTGGVITCTYAYSYGASTVPDGDNRWGCGFLAESGGVLHALGVVAEGCNLAGIAAYANGTVRAPNSSAINNVGGPSNVGSGYVARFGGMIDAGDGTATGNAGYGIDQDAESQVVQYGTMTINTNTLGSYARCSRAFLDGTVVGVEAIGPSTDADYYVRGKGAGGVRLGSSGNTVRQLRVLPTVSNVTIRSVNPSVSDLLRPLRIESTDFVIGSGSTLDGAATVTNISGGLAAGPNPTLGFLGATAIIRPIATGTRGGNAALASLLTALANLGLITDSTSV